MMHRFSYSIRIYSVAVGIVLLAARAGLSAWSQASTPASMPVVSGHKSADSVEGIPVVNRTQVKEGTNKTVPMGFSSGLASARREQTLEFRTDAQMNEQDRALLMSTLPLLRTRASIFDIQLNDGTWSHQQAVCPMLPNHLLLQFMHNGGRGDESVISAIIPRSGAGQVYLFPVQRRGYSLFTRAPMNAATISIFNKIRTEENITATPDWLTLGLCYATLAGAHARAELQAKSPDTEKFAEAMPATLVMDEKRPYQHPTSRFSDASNSHALADAPRFHRTSIQFVDTWALPNPMFWSMTFDNTGKLLEASHQPARMTKIKNIRQPLVEADQPK